jgi:hypothetical protein
MFSIFSVLPFFHAGFFPMHDDTQVARVYEMGKALSEGDFPVRWVKDLGYGYGYPIFNFYSPLPYYIGGGLTLFGLDALLATKITFIIGILASAVFMYFLAERFFGKKTAVLAGLLYIYFPYHAVNIYVRGALGELFAYAFLPLVFLGLLKIHYAKVEKHFFKSAIPSMLLASISIALVILSHNLSAFMLFLFVSLFIIISIIFSQGKLQRSILYCTVLVFAFLFSAFYSVPAALESSFTNVNSQVGGGAAYYDNFICPPQLWDSQWGFGGRIKGCVDGLSFRLGKLNIGLLAISVLAFIFFLRKVKEKKFIFLTSFGFFLTSIFMSLEGSQIIWEKLPYIDFLQYPWRFLNFAGLFMVIVIAYAFSLFEKIANPRNVMICVIIIILGTFFLSLKLFVPQNFLNVSSESYTNKQTLVFEISKTSDEYMPKYFEKPKSLEDVKSTSVDIVSGSGTVQITDNKTTYAKALIFMKNDGVIRLNWAYFPALKAFINGVETDYRVKSDGLYLDLPSGEHIIEIKFVQTFVENVGNTLSILGFLVVLIVIMGNSKIYSFWRKDTKA